VLLSFFQPIVASQTLKVLITSASCLLMDNPRRKQVARNLRPLFLRGIREALNHPSLCDVSSSGIGLTMTDCLSMADYEVFDLLQSFPFDPHPFAANPTQMLWESIQISRLRQDDQILSMPNLEDLINKWHADPNSKDQFDFSLAIVAANQNPSAFAALLPHIDGDQVKIDPTLIRPSLSRYAYNTFVDHAALVQAISSGKPDQSSDNEDQPPKKF
jgi:hypothetical protein